MVQKLGHQMWRRGVSQTEMAERLGASLKHINRVINGRDQASDELLESWATELGGRFRVEWECYDDVQ